MKLESRWSQKNKQTSPQHAFILDISEGSTNRLFKYSWTHFTTNFITTFCKGNYFVWLVLFWFVLFFTVLFYFIFSPWVSYTSVVSITTTKCIAPGNSLLSSEISKFMLGIFWICESNCTLHRFKLNFSLFQSVCLLIIGVKDVFIHPAIKIINLVGIFKHCLILICICYYSSPSCFDFTLKDLKSIYFSPIHKHHTGLNYRRCISSLTGELSTP